MKALAVPFQAPRAETEVPLAQLTEPWWVAAILGRLPDRQCDGRHASERCIRPWDRTFRRPMRGTAALAS